MHTPRALRTCALHVVVTPGTDPRHVADLAATLGHRLTEVRLLVPVDEDAGVEPYRLALDVADAVERAGGRRPRCFEVAADLGRGVADALAGPPAHRIVAVDGSLRRRAARTLRRAAADAGAHVAVLPAEQVSV